ncbi:MAG: hypothetical protein WCC26_08370 [Terracidiphilus sp.]
MPDDKPNETPATALRPAALYADLANGLHAMAQPLTILRGALGALAMVNAVAPEHERYLEMSTREIERLCDMMFCLQGLLDAASHPADCKPVSLAEVIEPVLELEKTFSALGLRIEAALPAAALDLLCDADRTERALRSAVKTLASLAEPGSVLKFTVDVHPPVVDLVLLAESAPGKRFGSQQRLGLSLMEASLRSQQGTMELSEDPLRIVLRLPVRSQDQRRAEFGLPFPPSEHSGSPLQEAS